MPKPSKTWKNTEKKVAGFLSPVFGIKLSRNPLSGANNIRDNGERRRGDVIIPEGYPIIVEVKHRACIGFHRFYDQAQDDCVSSGWSPNNAILFSHETRKKQYLATVSESLLVKLLLVAKEAGKLKEVFS